MQKKDVRKQVRIRTTLIAALALLALVPLSAQQPTAEMLKMAVGLFDMVAVSGGSFKMGSARDGPIHTVTVSGFKMSRTEVTQAQYEAITGKNPSYFKSKADYAPNRPVEQVSWYEAVAFCNLLSSKEGLTPAYTIAGTTVTLNQKATGYRLPTEAEWEYAARGGGKPDGTTYSGSNDIDTVAWYENNSDNGTHAVAMKAANSLGLFDMSGNVWEWCWDWYGAYSATAQTNPLGAASGTGRLVRGGGWRGDPSGCAVAYRGVDRPNAQYIVIGFRVVRP